MYRHIPQKRTFGWNDLLVLSVVALLIYGLVGVAQHWAGSSHKPIEIDLSPEALPKYAFLSFMRGVASYLLSLAFTLGYGYAAAKIPRAERVLIPFLDILQAIPVLGFMPGLILAMVTLFPDSNIGIELTCIIMIFTGQAWNMVFSFYSSLKTVPADLTDVARVMRLSWFQRFKNVELPFAAIGLAWNSLMSMAGGWFFLTVCESFVLGERKFMVPGIGSYMAVAIERGDRSAMLYGVVAMAAIIVFADFVIWRPVMAWVRKFQMEQIPEELAELPFVTTLLRESWVIRRLKIVLKRLTRKRPVPRDAEHAPMSILGDRLGLAVIRERIRRSPYFTAEWAGKLFVPLTIVICFWGGTRVWELVRTLTLHDWKVIWGSVGLTFVRIFLAVIVASLWTIPVAILIGMSPRATRVMQPVVQIAASFPSPMIFPVVIALMLRVGLTLHWGSAVLLMISVQWYILFNTLAGAMSITRDLKDTMRLIGTSRKATWWKLYLPSAFPQLVTGWITAAGGAWNASIVAEYVLFNGQRMTAPGIGSMISRATEAGNYAMLAGSLIALVITVVGLNQTWWRWLSEMAETRFRFER